MADAEGEVLYSKIDGERNTIRVNQDGTLEYTLDGGVTWHPVAPEPIKWK